MQTASPSLPRIGSFLHYSGVPLILLTGAPTFVMAIWYVNAKLDGSFAALGNLVMRDGVFATLLALWGPTFFGSPVAWAMLAVFAALQYLLLRYLPGAVFLGPKTAGGRIPAYRANGVMAFSITLAAFWLASYQLHWFSAGIVYDHFGELLGALNLTALMLCLVLYFKGRGAAVDADNGASGNVIFDYYWGTELHPRLLGCDVKQFTNCRIGMMGWAVIVLSFAAKQQETQGLSDSMLVCAALQLVYIGKFFLWETGYFKTLDMMHDRAGFYICWGCLVWVPGLYTTASAYLVSHPYQLGTFWSLTLVLLGIAGILVTYVADTQRQQVRDSAGQSLVWGRPPRVVRARYMTQSGESGENLLLASGFWGISRHFHYLTEILGALCWTLPALLHHFSPYIYVIFLAILLTHRAIRDDQRCAAKYGEDWTRFCQLVRYRIIPGVY